jgi:heptosyltransferase II
MAKARHRGERSPMPSSQTRPAPGAPRILIVKLAAMGDIVMASTLVAAARARWPTAHVTWLTGEGFAPLVRRFAGVDAVRTVDADSLLAGPGLGEALRAPRAGLRRAKALAESLRAISRVTWDVALVAHSDPRYAQLLRFASVKELRQFGQPQRDRYMGQDYALLLDQPEADLATLNWPSGAPPSRARARRVLLAPGGARNLLRDDPLRRWPAAQWAALARQLADAGCDLRVIGAAADRPEADVVRAAVPGVQDAVGQQGLEELLVELATADVLVTHDSGPLHLAQLTRTPSVALFGPTRAAERIAPGARVSVHTAAAGLPCAPCYDGRDYADCALNLCLTRVEPAAVAASVLELLG